MVPCACSCTERKTPLGSAKPDATPRAACSKAPGAAAALPVVKMLQPNRRTFCTLSFRSEKTEGKSSLKPDLLVLLPRENHRERTAELPATNLQSETNVLLLQRTTRPPRRYFRTSSLSHRLLPARFPAPRDAAHYRRGSRAALTFRAALRVWAGALRRAACSARSASPLRRESRSNGGTGSPGHGATRRGGRGGGRRAGGKRQPKLRPPGGSGAGRGRGGTEGGTGQPQAAPPPR